MVEAVNREFKRNPRAVENYEAVVLKMYYLNLDKIRDDFLALFSITGRPSDQQPEVFRSLLLMSHFKFAGIDEWVAHALATPILCALVGVAPDSFPGASIHRDFLLRLRMDKKPNRLKKFKPKPKGKHGKRKLPPKHPGIVAYMVKKALSGEVFKAIPERLLQTIFMKTAVKNPPNKGGALSSAAFAALFAAKVPKFHRRKPGCLAIQVSWLFPATVRVWNPKLVLMGIKPAHVRENVPAQEVSRIRRLNGDGILTTNGGFMDTRRIYCPFITKNHRTTPSRGGLQNCAPIRG